MSDTGQRWQQMRKQVPEDVELVAVSKFHPASQLLSAYEAGCRVFGESRVQELCAKHEALPKDIAWHFIGHLQPNKVKYIAPFVSLIHAVDTPKLLTEVNKRGLQNDRCIPCLLQVHIAQEETKFGFTPEELTAFLAEGSWRELRGVSIQGLMCMATNTDDMLQVRQEFARVLSLFQELKQRFFADNSEFAIRSYGMRHDWREAIGEGSNMVRIGTAIFGERTV